MKHSHKKWKLSVSYDYAGNHRELMIIFFNVIYSSSQASGPAQHSEKKTNTQREQSETEKYVNLFPNQEFFLFLI